MDFPRGGNDVTTSAANFSATAPETNSRCSIAEGALANSLLGGENTVHKTRYPSSIHVITTGLRTKVRQNSWHLVMLPVAIAPWPAGSHGGFSSPSAFSKPTHTSGDAFKMHPNSHHSEDYDAIRGHAVHPHSVT